MIGRGLLFDPSLADKLTGFASETDYTKFRQLHDTVYQEYQKILSPDINVLYKTKELWSYWQTLFEGSERDIKRLLKAKKYAEYEDAVGRILKC
jgi:tRNA-dihydrouridine synthase